jgi:heme exporter protein D
MAAIGDFLAMGGYAGFVWPAYGVAALVLIALVITSVRRARSAEAEVRVLEDTRPPRRAGPKDGAP